MSETNPLTISVPEAGSKYLACRGMPLMTPLRAAKSPQSKSAGS